MSLWDRQNFRKYTRVQGPAFNNLHILVHLVHHLRCRMSCSKIDEDVIIMKMLMSLSPKQAAWLVGTTVATCYIASCTAIKVGDSTPGASSPHSYCGVWQEHRRHTHAVECAGPATCAVQSLVALHGLLQAYIV